MTMIAKIKYSLVIFTLLSVQNEVFSQSLQFQKEKEGIRLLENNRPRFFYQTATKAQNGQYPRANYVHPLYGLNGEKLTEDFPEDHLHHHGIFWSWHQLFAEGQRVGDPWISEGVSWEVKNTSTEVINKTAIINAEILWVQISKDRPVIKENLLISYERVDKEAYTLTFDISLTALVEGVAIGGSEDAKGYGGFSPRFKLPEDISFSSTQGKVEPHNLPVQAGPWMNLTGHFDPSSNRPSGVVIMGEPEKLPSYKGWILRSAKSMQNMAFPGKNPISLKKGEALEFRNQILVHQNLNTEKISEYYNKFR
jgi:hypothetical protein